MFGVAKIYVSLPCQPPCNSTVFELILVTHLFCLIAVCYYEELIDILVTQLFSCLAVAQFLSRVFFFPYIALNDLNDLLVTQLFSFLDVAQFRRRVYSSFPI